MTRRTRGWLVVSIAVLAAVAALSGCTRIAYYMHTVRGQMDVLARREPVAELVADAATPDTLRARLIAVQSMRNFASQDLHLPDNDSYRTYADLERRYVVWNVFATDAYDVEPRQWCFLIVGCVAYRGYFQEQKAQDYARQLAADGLDVYVGGVAAYSTLGKFADPVMNTMLFNDDMGLAALLFHELAHQQVYVNGDTAFNEAFATSVEEEGLRRWLLSRGDEALFEQYQLRRSRSEQFADLVGAARERLRSLYASPATDAEREAAKRAQFEQLQRDYAALKAQWGGYAGYDRWFARDLNNAHLASVATYRELVPAFRALLLESGGDLQAFYARAEALSRLKPDARAEALAALSAPQAQDGRGS